MEQDNTQKPEEKTEVDTKTAQEQQPVNESNYKEPAPAIVINTQYIKDMSLEIPHAPEIFREITSNPEININVDVNASHLHDNFFNVSLNITMDADINGKKLFILELVYCSVVSLNVPQEHLEPVLLVEIPHQLFPFARAVVTNTLISGGLPPFMLNPIDFAAMYAARNKVQK